MTDDEINLKIATVCGWQKLGVGQWKYGMYGWNDPKGKNVHSCPNYCNDLNAMREAELGLDIPKLEAYSELLHKNCFRDYLVGMCEPNPIFAGAYQRAKTFIELFEV